MEFIIDVVMINVLGSLHMIGCQLGLGQYLFIRLPMMVITVSQLTFKLIVHASNINLITDPLMEALNSLPLLTAITAKFFNKIQSE